MQYIFTLDEQGEIGIVNDDFLIENFQHIIFCKVTPSSMECNF